MSQSPNSRLKAYLKGLDDSFETISNKTGLSRRSWHRLTEEGVSINSDYLLKLKEIYGADINWILTGNKSVTTLSQSKEDFLGSNQSVQTSEQENNESANSSSHSSTKPVSHQSVPTSVHQANDYGVEYDPEEFTSVPFYPGVYASGGQGLIAENEQSLPILFRKYFFSTTVYATPANCFMIRIKGDSMHPLYPDGADLLVDRARTRIKEGPGFLVRIGDSLYCKLLRTIPGGDIEMRSKNEDYQPVKISPGEKDFEVIGEVIWHAAKSKYI